LGTSLKEPDLVVLRMMNALITGGGIPLESIHPSLKNSVSQLAIESIIVRGPGNLSQIAAYVRERAGKASRTTVRLRMGELVRDGLVVRASKDKFCLTETFLADWCKRLGFIRRAGIFEAEQSPAIEPAP